MKIKNFSYFRRAAASIALSFVISMSSVAGQFDALHQGIAQNTDTLIGNWQLFFPGLESQINAAFEEGRKTGNFFSTAMPLRSHGMSLKTVPLRSTPLTRVISSRSAIPRITNFFSRGSLSIVKTSIFLPDAILSLLPSP